MLKQYLTKVIAVATIAAASVAITVGCGDEVTDETDPPPPAEDENNDEKEIDDEGATGDGGEE